MGSLPEGCASCGDKSIQYRIDTDDDVNEPYWILKAGICEIEILFCPYCGFPLVTGMSQEDLSG